MKKSLLYLSPKKLDFFIQLKETTENNDSVRNDKHAISTQSIAKLQIPTLTVYQMIETYGEALHLCGCPIG